MYNYIGIILIERELMKCMEYLTVSRFLYQLREHGFNVVGVAEDAEPQVIVHDLISLAIRNHKMQELSRGLGCMPVQTESWLEWARQFDRITSRFNLNNVVTAIEAAPNITAASPVTTRTWSELSDKLADVGDETYLICFYLTAMYGPEFDFTNLAGEDEESRSHSLVEKCLTECKLVALITIMDAVGVAAEMPHLQNLAANWLAQAIAEDRRCG